VYNDLMSIIVKLAEHGLIHGDFNEFNIMIDDNEKITIIDFPQMVSVDHENGDMYFDRDVNCIRIFFERRFGYVGKTWPKLHIDTARTHSLDKQVTASGFTKELQKEFEQLTKEQGGEDSSEEENSNESEEKSNENEHQQGANSDTEGHQGPEQEVNQEVNSDTEGHENTEQEENEFVDKETVVEPEKTRVPLKQPVTKQKGNDDKSLKFISEKENPQVNSDDAGSQEEKGHGEGDGEESDEEAKKYQKEKEKRVKIQQRVKRQLAQKQKRQKGLKNTYKNRDKRAFESETKSWSDAFT